MFNAGMVVDKILTYASAISVSVTVALVEIGNTSHQDAHSSQHRRAFRFLLERYHTTCFTRQYLTTKNDCGNQTLQHGDRQDLPGTVCHYKAEIMA
jgi:hypothetical protein